MHVLKLLPLLCMGCLGIAAMPAVGLAQTGLQAGAETGSGNQAVPIPASASGAPAPISLLCDRLTRIERMSGGFAQRAQVLAPAIDTVFNLQVVLQNSLGQRYRTLPDTQKQQLLDQFRQFTIARYVSNFAPGGTDRFQVNPAATASPLAGEQIVHTRIVAGDGGTDVNYVMRQGPAGWQVVDVLLNGNISQVAVQRADFGSSLISGDATPLIDSLRKKTRAFSQS